MTEKLFYEDSHRTEFTAKVISCEEAKDGFCVVLDQTAFFPEGGGQYADTGILGNTEVTDVHEKNDVMANAFQDLAPHKICAYIYDLANAFNRFYHETKILAEEDAGKQKSYIALLKVTKDVLEACIDVLGFEAPERM